MDENIEERLKIELQCPKCKKKNTVSISRPLKCKYCNETITNQKGKKMIATIVVALVLGLGSGHAVDDLFEKNRYPVDVEYGIIETCLTANERRLSYKNYSKKKAICECALLKTQEKFGYSGLKHNEDKFMAEFQEQVDSCLNEY